MGVEKQVIRPGTGPKPAPGQTVTVHCTGFGKGGDLSQKFWSTKDAGQKPFSFQIGKGAVIKGWDEGVIGMQIGEVARLCAHRITHMELVDFRRGESSQTRFSTLKSKY